MDQIRRRIERHRKIKECYDPKTDEVISAIWSARLRGRRIVWNDHIKTEETRIAASPMMIQMQPSSRLLSLPAELRLQILEEALKPGIPSAVPLIFACKQLFVEGRNIAMQNNTVHQSDLPSYPHSRRPKNICRRPMEEQCV